MKKKPKTIGTKTKIHLISLSYILIYMVLVLIRGRGNYIKYLIYVYVRILESFVIKVLDRNAKAFGGHVSCRNTKRKGWAYVTAGSPHFEVFAIKLDSSQKVQHFTHTWATDKHYSGEPQGTVNPEGTKVIFASNWDGDEIYSYVAEVPLKK